MRVLVTGGSGLLGNATVRELRSRDMDVVVLLRRDPEPAVFDGLVVDRVYGSLGSPLDALSAETSETWLGDAISQCDAVIHSAAHIHIGRHQLDQSMAVNRLGTRQIAEACRRHAKRLAYIGTVNTLAVGQFNQPADETTLLDRTNRQVRCAYTLSKRGSVLEVMRCVAQGLEAILVHPGFMLGPWDWKPSSGRMILELARRWTPFAPSGGCTLCDSRDVAVGIVNALTADVESGRSFIMGGHNLTYHQLWQEIVVRLDLKPPVGRAPGWLQTMAGHLGDMAGFLTGHESDLNGAAVRMSQQYHWYDSSRAQTELGYRNRPVVETLDDAVAWIRQHHLTI